MRINVNNRLKKVSDFIDSDSSLLDIGCDHAFLDIHLLVNTNKNISKLVASDNKEGPLNIAKENITKFKLDKKIETRFGNGLDVYTSDINTVVISGMGGRTIIGIIKEHLECLKTIDTFVLSPNNYQMDVRKFLCKHGYIIDKEEFIKEGKIIYQVIKFIKGKKKYSKKEYFFGPILLKEKNELFNEYYGRELKQREIILDIVPKGHFKYKFKIKREIKMLKDVLK